ncbi:hypothetical protein [Streptomyces antimycoticus]|uniref:hypothetical protein n=1 Tax=Streptomyces antimycoticus TaxID=68175 RepID=UPI00368CD38A
MFRTLYPAVDLMVLGRGDVLARLGRLFDEQLRLAVQRRFRHAAPRTVSQISQDPAHRLDDSPRGQLRQLLFCPFHGSLCVRGFLHSGLRDREVDGGARDPVLVLDAVVRGGRLARASSSRASWAFRVVTASSRRANSRPALIGSCFTALARN